MTLLTSDQCRAARGLLDWPQARLGAKSGLSEGTVRDFEKGKRGLPTEKLIALRSALELAGVAFLGNGEAAQGGPGVRLRESIVSRAHIHEGEAGITRNSEM